MWSEGNGSILHHSNTQPFDFKRDAPLILANGSRTSEPLQLILASKKTRLLFFDQSNAVLRATTAAYPSLARVILTRMILTRMILAPVVPGHTILTTEDS